jgi:plastocyanin domain-containing protein
MNSESSNSQSVSSTSSSTSNQTQVEHFKMRTWSKVLLTLVLLGVIGGGAYWYLVKKNNVTLPTLPVSK